MPGRITQDALENVFLQIRRKSVSHLSPAKFREALKLVSSSQLLCVPLNATLNYSEERR